ncbi:MAG: hypothetical protein KAV87_50350 [Desulfobacteraceae bacterium]|nr:hypothetical protein [Desulfobacteraceae bacterium]
MERFGFNERSIIDACATILSAHRLASFKLYPAVYFPTGWFQDGVAITRSDRENRILTAIAVTYPFPMKEITDAYDRLKSYDTVIRAVEEAIGTSQSLSFVVDDILIRRTHGT